MRILAKKIFYHFVNPRGKINFINELPLNARILDVGCGNSSAEMVKAFRPDIYYVGLDIQDYNQTADSIRIANEIHYTSPENFHARIEEFGPVFDAVISTHNLEHCNDYVAVTKAMVSVLKPEGKLFIKFPCEASASFPSRNGTLNFFDDETHKNLIPYKEFIQLLLDLKVVLLFNKARYRPILLFLIGLICEPYCRMKNKHAPWTATWALYGFETTIICRK